MFGTPTVFFNGGRRTVGSNPPPEPRYREAIEALLADSTAIELTVGVSDADEEGAATLSVSARIADGETVSDPGSLRVRALLYEDEVGGFNHVVRAVVLDLPLGISESGHLAVFDAHVAPDPSWKEEDLMVVAWVQRGADGEILNAILADWAVATSTLSRTWGSIKSGYFGPAGAN